MWRILRHNIINLSVYHCTLLQQGVHRSCLPEIELINAGKAIALSVVGAGCISKSEITKIFATGVSDDVHGVDNVLLESLSFRLSEFLSSSSSFDEDVKFSVLGVSEGL